MIERHLAPNDENRSYTNIRVACRRQACLRRLENQIFSPPALRLTRELSFHQPLHPYTSASPHPKTKVFGQNVKNLHLSGVAPSVCVASRREVPSGGSLRSDFSLLNKVIDYFLFGNPLAGWASGHDISAIQCSVFCLCWLCWEKF